ncbi:MAG: hypothetical protein BLM47_02050 [Candidatus Reconcilbacillus cellulovorans]|uniref:Uncharacterized protein n=1 Tax=Candidatus Reconcilbacillus cellulovorans TaxID=1906605 RepID=A0A2A6E2J4_9BACL|nr:MAG: hypothetical protein BLM47_02050 [Candidatus Reconcilbacillus cellulovorans]
MYGWLTVVAVAAGAAALAVTAYAAWELASFRRRTPQKGRKGGFIAFRIPKESEHVVVWTWADWIALGLAALGGLFLLADAVAVVRDRDAYPFYHLGYLLSGFVYVAVAVLFLTVRLAALFGLVRAGRQPEPAGRQPGVREPVDGGEESSGDGQDGRPSGRSLSGEPAARQHESEPNRADQSE